MIDSIIIKGDIINRSSYSGNFDKLILKNLDEDEIKGFAESNLDMIDEDDIEENPLIYDIESYELVDEMESRGFLVIKPTSIVEVLKIESLKESLNIQ